jgi:hypothetical protein
MTVGSHRSHLSHLVMYRFSRADAPKQARTKSAGLTIVIKLGASVSLELFICRPSSYDISSSSPSSVHHLTPCPDLVLVLVLVLVLEHIYNFGLKLTPPL